MSFSSLPDATAAQRLSGLLDSAMDGIISVDDGQRIVLFNRAAQKMFGYAADEIRGKPVDVLIPRRFRPDHSQQVRRFGATGTTSRSMGDNTVLYALRKTGEEFPIEASISQLQTPDGKIYTVILSDITERVRAREELATFAAESAGEREQEKSRIARELHDELAQSLTALKMDTMWMRDNLPVAPEVRQRLAHMLLACMRERGQPLEVALGQQVQRLLAHGQRHFHHRLGVLVHPPSRSRREILTPEQGHCQTLLGGSQVEGSRNRP